MPELPEVETVRRGLVPRLVGRRIVRLVQRRRDLRVPLPAKFAQRVEGRRVLGIDRRAKYLLLRLDDGHTLIAHLGMSGRMTLHDAASAAEHPFGRHDHVVFETEEGWQVRFNDARRFGLMLLAADEALPRHKLFKGLGPEPLDDAFDGAALQRALDHGGQLHTLLRDQRAIAGIGRAYANEILHAARLSPFAPADRLDPDEVERLYDAIREQLTAGIEDFRQFGARMALDKKATGIYHVHRKAGEPCPRCREPLQRVDFAHHEIVYCPACQTEGKVYADRRRSRLLK
jgi:formamidopyrimidine-DNA glycosylase